MKRESEATVHHVRCKSCPQIIQVRRPFTEDEVRSIECRSGHKHDYTASDVQSRTSTAFVGR